MSGARNRQAQTGARSDYLLIIAVTGLLIIGLMMVFSTTAFRGVRFDLLGDRHDFFPKQLAFAAAGLLIMFGMARIPYHFWQKVSIPILLAALGLLALVLVIADEKFGGMRWLADGSIQPSEAARLAIIIYIAHWLSSKGARIREVTYGLVPFAVILGLVAGLIILQPNLSIALLIVMTSVAMFFIAGGSTRQIIVSGLLSCVPLVMLIMYSDYRRQRFFGFFSPEDDLYGSASHMLQSKIALALGGVVGVGPGNSIQKYGYLPTAHTDSILAILGEEWGLVGCLVVVGLFALLAYRGFRVAMQAPDVYGAVLASGLTCSLIFQALVNMAVVTAVVPTTGVPLPFISYGGSSLISSLASVGLLLAVSRGAAAGQAAGAERARGELADRESHDLGRRDGRTRVPRPVRN